MNAAGPAHAGRIGDSHRSLPARTPGFGISVVIPAYNYAHHLRDAIDSALAQDHLRFEVIVVDDGSTDNTREVAAAYGDRVRYVHQDNAGLSAARNTGMAVAQHEWIALLDADDEFLPGMLRTLAETAAGLPPEYGLIACGCEHMTVNRELIPKKKLTGGQDREVSARDILLTNQFVADAVLFRRDLALKAGGFDTSLRSSEDRDLWIRLSQFCRLYLVSKPLVRIRVHGASMSKNAARMRTNMLRVLEKARAAGVVNSRDALFWARAHGFLHYQTAWMFRDAGDYKSALRELMLSLLKCPFFLRPHRLNENYLFRVRSLAQFLREALTGKSR
jgi:glycosyltransferase involved in cell wall biosynthesis